MTLGFGASRRSLIALVFLTATTTSACRPSDPVDGPVRAAVATNFVAAFEDLARSFEEQTGHRVVSSAGSTGKLYAQIVNGGPFDVFFAADSERARRLEESGRAVDGSRFAYALGRLVLWSREPGVVDARGEVLAADSRSRLAIANPELAPYGRAARAVLEARGLWDLLGPRIVRGENVGQTFQFVSSGNARLGFVAKAQLLAAAGEGGSRWEVPSSLHPPIRQEAVLLRDRAAAKRFLAFVRSPEGRRIIARHGYEPSQGEASE